MYMRLAALLSASAAPLDASADTQHPLRSPENHRPPLSPLSSLRNLYPSREYDAFLKCLGGYQPKSFRFKLKRNYL